MITSEGSTVGTEITVEHLKLLVDTVIDRHRGTIKEFRDRINRIGDEILGDNIASSSESVMFASVVLRTFNPIKSYIVRIENGEKAYDWKDEKDPDEIPLANLPHLLDYINDLDNKFVKDLLFEDDFMWNYSPVSRNLVNMAEVRGKQEFVLFARRLRGEYVPMWA